MGPQLRGHTHLGYPPPSPRLGAGSALLPRCACWASGRPQVSLATTLCHATRTPPPTPPAVCRALRAPLADRPKARKGRERGRARGRRAESERLCCLENGRERGMEARRGGLKKKKKSARELRTRSLGGTLELCERNSGNCSPAVKGSVLGIHDSIHST